jgi:hypothetical protein
VAAHESLRCSLSDLSIRWNLENWKTGKGFGNQPRLHKRSIQHHVIADRACHHLHTVFRFAAWVPFLGRFGCLSCKSVQGSVFRKSVVEARFCHTEISELASPPPPLSGTGAIRCLFLSIGLRAEALHPHAPVRAVMMTRNQSVFVIELLILARIAIPSQSHQKGGQHEICFNPHHRYNRQKRIRLRLRYLHLNVC